MSHCLGCQILADRKSRITVVKGDPCPGCGHEVELAALRAQLVEMQNERDALNAKLTALARQDSQISGERETYRRERDQAQEECQWIRRKLGLDPDTPPLEETSEPMSDRQQYDNMVRNAWNAPGAPQAHITQNLGGVGASMKEMENAIENLTHSLQILSDKLNPILSPEPPGIPTGSDTPKPPLSELADLIHGFAIKIGIESIRVESITRRVDL